MGRPAASGRRRSAPACACAGFTKRDESEYDPFGAGHSSTSISAALGMAVGRDVKGKKNNVIAVIGDGAITGGMAYEAMNHAGFLDKNMIVILNDNQQVGEVCCSGGEPGGFGGPQGFGGPWDLGVLLAWGRAM